MVRKEIDVGNIPFEGNAKGKFEIINIGSKDLIIREVDPGCDCTIAEQDKDEISPGDTLTLMVEYEHTHLPGDFFRVIEVIANVPEGSFRLILKGNINYK